MPVTHMPAGSPKGGQFAPGNSGGVSGGGRATRNTPERKELAERIKIRRNLAKHYDAEAKKGGSGGVYSAKPETVALLKKGKNIYGDKTRGDSIRRIEGKGTAERNEKAASLREDRTRAQIRSKLGYKSATQPASAPTKSVDPGVAKIRALGEKFDKLQRSSDLKNKIAEDNRIEKKKLNTLSDRARYAAEDKANSMTKVKEMQAEREKADKARPKPKGRTVRMADGSVRKGGKLVGPTGSELRDKEEKASQLRQHKADKREQKKRWAAEAKADRKNPWLAGRRK